MLGLRTTIILSLVLALIVNTAAAGSSGKYAPSCTDCFSEVENCKKHCKDQSAFACQLACDCIVSRKDFCRKSCEIGGPESGCESF